MFIFSGRDFEEHVSSLEEDDQGTDRVVDRAQVHAARRGQHQHVHLHGLVGRRTRSSQYFLFQTVNCVL